MPLQMLLVYPFLSRRGTSVHSMIARTVHTFTAESLFSQMKSLITQERYNDALSRFDARTQQRTATNLEITQALRACAKTRNLERGAAIHRGLALNSINDLFLQSSLINFYLQCGEISTAEKIFKSVSRKTPGMYGAMLKGLATNDRFEEALDLFESIPFQANEIILTIVFNICAQMRNDRALKLGKSHFEQAEKTGRVDKIGLCSALDMFMQCGHPLKAEEIFAKASQKNPAMYGVMIKGLVANGRFEEALDLFESMPFQTNEIILLIVFKICARMRSDRALKLGNKHFQHAQQTGLINHRILCSALNMFMQCGDSLKAEQIFGQVSQKSPHMYGAMLKGLATNKRFDEALDLFESMPFPANEIILIIVFNICAQMRCDRAFKLGKKHFEQAQKTYHGSDIFLSSALDMFMQCGDVSMGEHVFAKMKEKSIIVYNIMIKGYNTNNKPEKSLVLFQEMERQNIVSDQTTFTLLAGTCSQIGSLSLCQMLVDQIARSLPHIDVQLQCSLIDMWGKCGSTQEANSIFQTIEKPTASVYNAMINSYGLNGKGLQAVELYGKMSPMLIDERTEVCVLNACSHSGLINEARAIFDQISRKSTRTVTTMVDCFSRLSLFIEAQKLIDEYEQSNPPSVVAYTALLSGARNQRDSVLSKKVFERMQRLFPDQKECLMSSSILLANTLSSVGEHVAATNVRRTMRQSGHKVKAGLSWTYVNGKLVYFHAHDQSHPQWNEIFAELNRLSKELVEHGHRFDSSWVTRPLEDDETVESVLCGHSEKLAIAFNLMQSSVPSPIQVAKNLRICGDCHGATKLIAKIRQCEIFVRDANRMHHFTPDGQCSCTDHF